MRKFLIPAVSLAALTMGGFAIAQDTTTPAPTPEQPAQVQPDPNTTTPPVDTGAAPAAPDAGTTAQDPAAAPTPPETTAEDKTAPAVPDPGTAATGNDTTTTTTTPTDTAATGATGPGFLATSVIGRSVYSPSKENIGDINDLMVGEKGEVTAAIIGVGGFLGLGEKDVAVPLDKLSMSKDENGMEYLTITASREELEAAPAFDRTMVTGSLQ